MGSHRVDAPEAVRTERLHLRRPTFDDVDGMFAYASDPEITRYMAWPRQVTTEDTAGHLAQADSEWDHHGVGAYLICQPQTGEILGSTGLHLSTSYRAVTGYILHRAAWGQGYATEACRAMVEIARTLGLARIEADCHVDHAASRRVLEKAGLLHEGILRSFLVFPNLDPEHAQDVHLYALAL